MDPERKTKDTRPVMQQISEATSDIWDTLSGSDADARPPEAREDLMYQDGFGGTDKGIRFLIFPFASDEFTAIYEEEGKLQVYLSSSDYRARFTVDPSIEEEYLQVTNMYYAVPHQQMSQDQNHSKKIYDDTLEIRKFVSQFMNRQAKWSSNS